MDGALYDPTAMDPNDPLGAAMAMPQGDMSQGSMPPLPSGNPSFFGQVGQSLSNGFGKVQQFAQNNPGLLMAAAAGIGKGTPMGDMAASIQDHMDLQDKMQQKKDAAAAMAKLQQAKADETARMNSSKISLNSANAIAKGTAKVTDLGNGFVSVMAPGETTPTIVANEEYQKFAIKKIDQSGQWNVLAAGARADAQPLTAAQIEAQTNARAAAEASGDTLSKYRAVKQMLEQNGAPGMAALPILSQLNQAFGTEDAESMQRLGELKIEQGFKGIPKGQGAMTDFERSILLSPMPKDYADTKAWLAYVNRKIGVLEKADAFNQSELTKANDVPRMGMANANAVIQQMTPGAQSQAPAAAPMAAPVPQAAPPKMMQQYPPGFNPPSNGRANPEDQMSILTAERDQINARPDSDPRKAADLAAITREIQRAGGKPAQVAKPVAASGVPTFSTVADVKAAMAAGKLKSGDIFMDPQGNKRKVH